MRAPRLVAWGGRPGIDIQIGSRRDRRRYALQLRMAEHERRMRAIRTAMQAFVEVHVTLAAQVGEAVRPLARLSATLNGIDVETQLERWRRQHGR